MACTISGTVAYSYFVMPVTLAPSHPAATVAEMSNDDPGTMRRSARPPDRTEVTGPLQTDVYDVWEPTPGRARHVTVALVHGGFWREQYDRTSTNPLAEALANDGFHVVNLEYPRIGMPGGGWPGTGASVLARLESVHADTHLPDRAVVVGHSAGGHLVLWLASGAAPPGSPASSRSRRRPTWPPSTGSASATTRPASSSAPPPKTHLSPGPTPTPPANGSPARRSSSPASSTT